MKAVVCTRYGPPEVLQLKEVENPTPTSDEVRIRIFATAVTASDCIMRGLKLRLGYRLLVRLLFGFRAPRQPILGMVLAGEIDALGRNVTTFKVGDPVFGFGGRVFGAYAQYVCWSVSAMISVRPANLTFQEAAAIPYGGLLALFFIRRAGIKAGHHVLVYGASGAIGTAAVQLIRQLGAQVTGVCSTANLTLVETLGASAVIDYIPCPEQFYMVIYCLLYPPEASGSGDGDGGGTPGRFELAFDSCAWCWPGQALLHRRRERGGKTAPDRR